MCLHNVHHIPRNNRSRYMLRYILDACLRDIAKSLSGCINLAQGPRRLVHSRIECTRETRALRLGRERKYARSRVTNT